ncbi:MAG: hypothetical protein AB1894_28050 [Chloroflexota bacterium]
MKDKSGFVTGSITLIFILAALGGLLGLGLGWNRATGVLQGDETPWRASPLPGGAGAARFVPGTGPVLYVESSDGQLFAAYPEDFSEWRAVASIEEGAIRSGSISGRCTSQDQSYGKRIPAPPETVKAQFDCEFRIPPESGGFVRIVLLEDGSLWRWSNYSNVHAYVLVPSTYLQYTCLYGLGYGLGGLALGLVLALFLAWRARRA